MTRFVHDQFAKDYLGGLLEPFGEVRAPLQLAGEVRQIDVWFTPINLTERDRAMLGLLGRFAVTSSLFEPFRNAVTPTEICNCLLKYLKVRSAYQRQATRNNTQLQEEDLPKLWILTPTASMPILNGFEARSDTDNWLSGVYVMPKYLRTSIVVIHQLPRTPETVWLRLLGKGAVQEQAIDEVEAMSEGNPLQVRALEALRSLRVILELRQEEQDEDDRRLIMRLSPIYLSRLEEASQQGIQQGVQQGIQQSIELALELKFGTLGLELLPEIALISDLERLKAIQRAAIVGTSLEELRQLMKAN